jgi:hypothetical protein
MSACLGNGVPQEADAAGGGWAGDIHGEVCEELRQGRACGRRRGHREGSRVRAQAGGVARCGRLCYYLNRSSID